ncbi:MAG: SLC13 family permease [Sphingomonadales bacterium]
MTERAQTPDTNRHSSPHRRVGLVLGPLLCTVMLALPAPEAMTAEAWNTAAVAVLMAVWWATEALPVPVTALMPLILFPVLGIATMRAAAAPFAHPLIFLFLGGFLIALAMQRSNLHRRIALNIVAMVGTRPQALVPGFMIATASISMWVSNTATTMMMMPIAVSVAAIILNNSNGESDRDRRNFATALLLGIAYSASIGGLATLIGTPPNAFLAAFMEQTHGAAIGFADWMTFGLPVVFVLLPLCWWVLTRHAHRFALSTSKEAGDQIAAAIRQLGPMSPPERRVAIIFGLAATLWMTRPLLTKLPGLGGLSDAGIALFCGAILFLVPSGPGDRQPLMNWEWAERLPWGVLILFGGGLSLAAAMSTSGLAGWIGTSLAIFGTWHILVLIFAVTACVLFLTELTSNTATTAAFLPVVGALAVSAGHDPLLLAAPAAVAASCAFMLPVATPPNAIIYGSGHVTIGQMIRAGLAINLGGLAAILGLSYLLLPLLFAGR